MKPKFRLGRVVLTTGALDALSSSDFAEGLYRHRHGDWGEVCPEDWQANERALRDGARLLSAYRTEKGKRFWIITEHDRSATTILLPEEY